MTRKEANMEIVRLIINYINMNPDQRFTQIIQNLDIVEYDGDSNMLRDNYHEESKDTLERIKNTLRGKHD
jgi:hypothetical protein